MIKNKEFILSFTASFIGLFLLLFNCHRYAFGFESVEDKKILGVGLIHDMEAFKNDQIYILSNNGFYTLGAATGKLINRYANGYDPSMSYALSPNGKWFLSFSRNFNTRKNLLLDSLNGNAYEDLSDFEIPLYPFSKLGDALLLKKDAGLYEYRIEDKWMSLIKADFFNESSLWRFAQFVDSEKKIIAGIEYYFENGKPERFDFFLWNRESQQKDLSVLLKSIYLQPNGYLQSVRYDLQNSILYVAIGYFGGLFTSSYLNVFNMQTADVPCGYISTPNTTGTFLDFAEDYSVLTFGSSSRVSLWNYNGICNNKKNLLGLIDPHLTSDYSKDSLNWYYILDNFDMWNNYNVHKVTLSSFHSETLFDLRKYPYHTASISFDNKNLAIKDDYKNVYLWDIEKLRSVQILEGVPSEGNLAFSPINHQLIWAASGTVSVWDKGEIDVWSKQKDIIAVENAGNTHVAYSQDGSLFLIASGTADQDAQNDVLEVWQSDSIKQKIALSEVGDGIQKAFFSPNGESMAAVYADGKILIWDVNSGEKLHEWKHSARIDCVEFRDDDELLLVDSERNLYVYRPEEQTFEKKMENLALPVKYIKKANLLLAGNQTIDVNTFQILKTLDNVKQDMASIELSPDESIMVLCRTNGEITEFDTDQILDGGNRVERYELHEK